MRFILAPNSKGLEIPMTKIRTAKTRTCPDPVPRRPIAKARSLRISVLRDLLGELGLWPGVQAVLDKLGLTYTQYIAMVALSEEDNQTVRALGEKLFLESNTLTPILKKLESTGYIRRHRDPADERQVRVSLTPPVADCLKRIPARRWLRPPGSETTFPQRRRPWRGYATTSCVPRRLS